MFILSTSTTLPFPPPPATTNSTTPPQPQTKDSSTPNPHRRRKQRFKHQRRMSTHGANTEPAERARVTQHGTTRAQRDSSPSTKNVSALKNLSLPQRNKRTPFTPQILTSRQEYSPATMRKNALQMRRRLRVRRRISSRGRNHHVVFLRKHQRAMARCERPS